MSRVLRAHEYQANTLSSKPSSPRRRFLTRCGARSGCCDPAAPRPKSAPSRPEASSDRTRCGCSQLHGPRRRWARSPKDRSTPLAALVPPAAWSVASAEPPCPEPAFRSRHAFNNSSMRASCFDFTPAIFILLSERLKIAGYTVVCSPSFSAGHLIGQSSRPALAAALWRWPMPWLDKTAGSHKKGSPLAHGSAASRAIIETPSPPVSESALLGSATLPGSSSGRLSFLSMKRE